jgi:hypothetical protein
MAYLAELPAGAERMSQPRLLERIMAAIVALDGRQAVAWTKAYLTSGGDRRPCVQQLALTACRLGNDPRNQEIAQCLLEDYMKNHGFDRDRLLLACVQHTAVHRKYGDFLEWPAFWSCHGRCVACLTSVPDAWDNIREASRRQDLVEERRHESSG